MNIVITAANQSTDLLDALAKGEAKVHNEREDGTLRRRHFLTGDALAEAEWVRLQRTGQEADESEGIQAVTPRSMASIAKEMHVSIAHIRRMLTDLAITEELLESDADELATMFQGATEAN